MNLFGFVMIFGILISLYGLMWSYFKLPEKDDKWILREQTTDPFKNFTVVLVKQTLNGWVKFDVMGADEESQSLTKKEFLLTYKKQTILNR